MTKYGICTLSVIPIRADASDRSEMTNQLLFGETFEVVDVIGEWLLIRGDSDGYEGFADKKQCHFLSDDEHKRLTGLSPSFPDEPVSEITETSSGRKFGILLGSTLRLNQQRQIIAGKQIFSYHGKTISFSGKNKREAIIATALKFLGAPYLWGGRSLFGIDCSGLTQVVNKINGISLPRDASQQAQHGNTLHLISEAQPGDLLFFDNDEEQIVHAGMLLDAEHIIHASGFVRIDKIDHYGIFNEERKNYTHKLRLIKQMAENN
jgi:hypothetical protein